MWPKSSPGKFFLARYMLLGRRCFVMSQALSDGAALNPDEDDSDDEGGTISPPLPCLESAVSPSLRLFVRSLVCK